MSSDLIYLNGKIIPANEAKVSVLDQGLLFGWGVFETLKTYNGKLFLLEKHLQRLEKSAKFLDISNPLTHSELTRGIYQYINDADLQNEVIRITLTKREKGKENIFFTNRSFIYTRDDYEKGFNAAVASMKRNPESFLYYHKTLNFLENMQNLQNAKKRGFQEALFLNISDHLCEGSISNLFFIKNNTIYTPSVDCGLLPGITRECIINTVVTPGRWPLDSFQVNEGKYTLNDLLTAEEAFLTNSIMGIMPLTVIENKPVAKGKVGKITKELMKIYEEMVEKQSK